MDTNTVPAVKIITVFLLTTSILVVIVRGTTKAVIVRSTSLDDYLIALSLVSTLPNPHCEPPDRQISILHTAPIQLFNIGQSVAVFFQVEHGYGMPSGNLSLSSLSSELKVRAMPSLELVLSN